MRGVVCGILICANAKRYLKCLYCRLQEQLSGLRAKPLDCSYDASAVDEWESLLTRKRRQIKKKKEQLRRIQDDG